MPPRRSVKPLIPTSFTAKKSAILSSLATPDATYTDASPKGSVDVAIRGLIDRINAIEGIVTTSSCAGRVSVFLEGEKDRGKPKGIANETDGDIIEGAFVDEVNDNQKQKLVPGGKGNGGRWLFVSHKPVDTEAMKADRGLRHMFGMESDADTKESENLSSKNPVGQKRLVRFQFEPMILHIMTASLSHAQPLLAAAINAGFRESGIQSLKNLDDPNAFPMVAVRTSGLAFESLIGVVGEKFGAQEILNLVSEEYLEILVNIANERFETNSERTRRFELELFNHCLESSGWEDAETRKARKKAEGLAHQVSRRCH